MLLLGIMGRFTPLSAQLKRLIEFSADEENGCHSYVADETTKPSEGDSVVVDSGDGGLVKVGEEREGDGLRLATARGSLLRRSHQCLVTGTLDPAKDGGDVCCGGHG
ncbi:hypothetical protein Droror1_Dr00015948 [Drosera rotundifolia]